MPDIQGMFKDVWSSARAGVTAAEAEAEKVLGRIGVSTEGVRRQARELGERLDRERRGLERGLDDAVRRAANRFRIPTRDDLETLQRRLDAVSERVEALSRRAPVAPPPPRQEQGE
ncbi:conserved hypothetical protein [Anaeromyxobacter dehalogenans 2CP-1]|uniref:Poly(Hydroxyalkanoate) granule-associated protein n=1 Tax=Anaeromyxobacter dehalogenans (strain ATCC BAA-258 / DSM 21875 / 2CP-1) TaxID=455488 RepID=B8JDE8_ANAD2|nr:phasin family protein [Anaeromyxobacter dehalogenans]ACL65997.1 conserved hypothetical protein [Anaeromyxobacter dehalogenans 2CP-1]